MSTNTSFTKKEKDWILYDVANSAYVLLATALLSFYRDYIAPTGNLTSLWGSVNVIVAVISLFLCPILGTLADFSNKRKFFFLFAVGGIVSCAIMSVFSAFKGFTIAGAIFLVVYIITETCFNSSIVFYDSMLNDVTTDEKMHKVSANGYAWGYIGSCVPFIVCLILYVLGGMIIKGNVIGYTEAGEAIYQYPFLGIAFTICCLITAAWWLIFTLPLYKSYEQIHFLPKPEKPVHATFKRLSEVFKDLAKNKKALFFLFAFFFYIDGVHTIIKMAMSIGNDLGFENFGAVKLVIALFVTQIVAFPFAILFGKLSSKFSCEKLLITCILGYTAIGVLCVFLRQEWQFWAMAVGVGMFQGGIQAMSRSYFTKIIPAEKSGEFFGIYDIFGKGAAILGVGLIAILSKLFPLSQPVMGMNVCLIPLPILFVIGLILFLVSMKVSAKTDSADVTEPTTEE